MDAAEVSKSETDREKADGEEGKNSAPLAGEAEEGADPEAVGEVDPVDETEEVDDLRALTERLREAERGRLQAERQVEDYADRFRKAQAQLRRETDEVRLRLQRNFEQQIDKARADLVSSLLETLDNLKRAVAAAETSARGAADFDALLDGVRATAELFETRMKALGLTPLESVGEQFDPELHEAVEIVEVAPEEDNRVVDELQPGYKFGDRLLRPARVRVGRAS